MVLEIPENVHQAMREGNRAWSRLGALVAANRDTWSKQQLAQLELIAEVIKHLQQALNRLINANL